MTLTDLIVLLRQDLTQSFRVSKVKGKRTEKKSLFRRFIYPIGAILIGSIIVWGITAIAPLFGWSRIALLLYSSIDAGATLFNFLLIFSFIGSIMISATTVGNSSRMEYLMTMPIALRTLFLEKTIVVIIYNSLIWLIIGTPIFIGLSITSTAYLAFFSIPTFIFMMLVLTTLGVSLGGLMGLFFSRLLAGRRRLKNIGWFVGTTVTILAGAVYYFAIISSDGFGQIFNFVFEIADALGFSSGISPGYATSAITLGLLVGAPLRTSDVILALIFIVSGIVLVNLNATISERAHYSGWLASGSKRTSKNAVPISHGAWDPQSIPGFKFNTAVSVSIWYNLANIRREGRVLAQYLIGPVRLAIFFIFPMFTLGDDFFFLTPLLIVYILVPFATSYGVYFAGYETVYEGRNLMNLQLSQLSMNDYVLGKVYSAVPFAVAASAVISVISTILFPSLMIYIPAIILSAAFINLAAGGIAANAAAIGGDFRAERMITRQRGSAVQMPIRGWSMLRTHLLPYLIGFGGLSIILGIGMFLNPLYSYVAVLVFGLLCIRLAKHYTRSAGHKLSQIEASEYL
ncbi:MAG: hypothetical protein ACFFE3_13800 [Candidatus Thorarchaeota archaeon]